MIDYVPSKPQIVLSIGEWCAPGDRQSARWLLTFDDADRNWNVYDSEDAARTDFARAEGLGWNCYLWELAPRQKQTIAPHSTAAQSGKEN